MRCAPTADGYNPTVLGLNVPAWKMDITFYNNLITIFTRDTTVANLPSVKAAWDALLYPPENNENAIVEPTQELSDTVVDTVDAVDTADAPHTEEPSAMPDFADTEPELALELPPEPTAEAFDPEADPTKKPVKTAVRKKVNKPAEVHFEIDPEADADDADADLFPPAP